MTTLTAILIACQAAAPSSREAELLRTWKAICWQESRGDPRAYNKAENALGIGQIRPIYVRDANRILRAPVFGPNDRLDPVASYAMFRAVVLHYAPQGGPKEWSRIHNGGGSGLKKRSTLRYSESVLQIMRDQARRQSTHSDGAAAQQDPNRQEDREQPAILDGRPGGGVLRVVGDR